MVDVGTSLGGVGGRRQQYIIIGPSPEKWKNLKGYHKADAVFAVRTIFPPMVVLGLPLPQHLESCTETGI